MTLLVAETTLEDFSLKGSRGWFKKCVLKGEGLVVGRGCWLWWGWGGWELGGGSHIH